MKKGNKEYKLESTTVYKNSLYIEISIFENIDNCNNKYCH